MRRLRTLIIAAAVGLPGAAAAVPGVTTTNVNLRAGPGTDFASLGILPGGTAVDLVDCQPGATWCSVTVGANNGFISGNYVRPVAAPIAEPAGTDVVEPTGDVVGNDGALLTDDQLDTLVAPIALYPDNLIAQVLVAATYPLEIVKADRWIKENTDLPDDEREAKATAEGWDESVAMLATAFPDVIAKMAEDLDWTQSLGEAMLAESDAVLDAVQRQRARAQAVGNLETNEAQSVQTVDNTIIIEPAQPNTVYVPVYNTKTVYTQPAPQQPVYVQTTTTTSNTGAAVAAGAIAFTAGLAIGSVFNNDYRTYWYGPPRVRWDTHYIYPRPAYRPPYRAGWGGNYGNQVNINGNVNIGNTVNVGNSIGNDRPGAWRPDDRRRQDARQDIKRKQSGGGQRRDNANRTGASQQGAGRPNSNSVEQRLNARSGGGGKVSRASSAERKGATRKGSANSSALAKPKGKTGTKAKKSANRGKTSKGRSAGSSQKRKSGNVSRPRSAKAPARRAAPKRTAMKKAPARRTQAARSRGRGRR